MFKIMVITKEKVEGLMIGSFIYIGKEQGQFKDYDPPKESIGLLQYTVKEHQSIKYFYEDDGLVIDNFEVDLKTGEFYV